MVTIARIRRNRNATYTAGDLALQPIAQGVANVAFTVEGGQFGQHVGDGLARLRRQLGGASSTPGPG